MLNINSKPKITHLLQAACISFSVIFFTKKFHKTFQNFNYSYDLERNLFDWIYFDWLTDFTDRLTFHWFYNFATRWHPRYSNTSHCLILSPFMLELSSVNVFFVSNTHIFSFRYQNMSYTQINANSWFNTNPSGYCMLNFAIDYTNHSSKTHP